jgi:hypothetical protein
MYVQSNHCCNGKAVSITYSEYVSVALGIQHAKCMRCIILPTAACLSLQYISTLSHKRHDFLGEKIIQHKICVLIFSTNLSEIFLVPKIILRDTIINVHTLSCKVPVITVRF